MLEYIILIRFIVLSVEIIILLIFPSDYSTFMERDDYDYDNDDYDISDMKIERKRENKKKVFCLLLQRELAFPNRIIIIL